MAISILLYKKVSKAQNRLKKKSFELLLKLRMNFFQTRSVNRSSCYTHSRSSYFDRREIRWRINRYSHGFNNWRGRTLTKGQDLASGKKRQMGELEREKEKKGSR